MICGMTTPDDERVAHAWARLEAALHRVLPDSLRLLAPPAEPEGIDAIESGLGVRLPPDFRASLRIHNGTARDDPSPVPLEYLFGAEEILEMTRVWDAEDDPDLADPGVIAKHVDDGRIHVDGPVRPVWGLANRVVVGTMNGDVNWFLDLEPPQGGTSGQVVRMDIECGQWDVLAPSWTELLHRYAEDLERFAADPVTSTIDLEEDRGPACEWGTGPVYETSRPEWLRDVEARALRP
jgi:cell wall assembly regulator SMI1